MSESERARNIMRAEKKIYVITNTITGKKYVGSTFRPDIRFKQHIGSLIRGTHHNVLMQEDFNKFGNCFEMEVVDSDEKSGAGSKEYEWIEKLKTFDSRFGYNDKDPLVRRIRKKYGLPVPQSPLLGRESPLKGIKHPDYYKTHRRSKITEMNEQTFCELRKKGMTYKEIGRIFNVSRQYVCQIVNRKNKRDLRNA